MARLAKGVATGHFGIGGVMLLVGDNIKAKDAYYYINGYRQAVPYGDGQAVPLKDLKPGIYAEVVGAEELEQHGYHAVDTPKPPKRARAEKGSREGREVKAEVESTPIKEQEEEGGKAEKSVLDVILDSVPEKEEEQPELVEVPKPIRAEVEKAAEYVAWLRAHNYTVICQKDVQFLVTL